MTAFMVIFCLRRVKLGWRFASWVESVWPLLRGIALRVARASQLCGTLMTTSSTQRCLLALKFVTSPPRVKYEQTRLPQMQRRRLGRVRKRNCKPGQAKLYQSSRFVLSRGAMDGSPSCISTRRQNYPPIVPAARARRGPQRSVRGRGPREATNSYYPGHFIPPVGHPAPREKS